MDTEGLTSYYPGYEDRDNEAKVPYDDYAELEDKLEIYKKAFEELEEVLEDTAEYKSSDKVRLSKAILVDMREELCD